MKKFKSFVIGSSWFVLLVPFAYISLGNDFNPGQIDMFKVVIGLPIIFGLINVFAVHHKNLYPVKSAEARYFLTGFIWGLVFSSYGVSTGLPTEIYRIPANMYYAPIFVMPFVYGAVWRYFALNLNKLFNLEK